MRIASKTERTEETHILRQGVDNALKIFFIKSLDLKQFFCSDSCGSVGKL